MSCLRIGNGTTCHHNSIQLMTPHEALMGKHCSSVKCGRADPVFSGAQTVSGHFNQILTRSMSRIQSWRRLCVPLWERGEMRFYIGFLLISQTCLGCGDLLLWCVGLWKVCSILWARKFLLSVDSHRCAEMIIVWWVQARSFALEIASLETSNGCLSKSKRLAALDPIIENGIVRVGGRIGKAPDSDDVKHPVLLPPDSPVSYLLVKKLHEDTCLGGWQQVLSRLRQRYWVIHGNVLS